MNVVRSQRLMQSQKEEPPPPESRRLIEKKIDQRVRSKAEDGLRFNSIAMTPRAPLFEAPASMMA